MINQCQNANNPKWPRYEEDITIKEGKVIRKAGNKIDAHHLQPLELGGQNTADNLTPMHARDHHDKQGIHRPGGAYDNMAKIVEIEKKYAVFLPMEVKMLLKDYEGQFIQVGDGEHYRILDKGEILDAERHLGLDCMKMGFVPLIDCKDNNFLVYNAGKNLFEMINIVDGMPFNSYKTLLAFWKDVH